MDASDATRLIDDAVPRGGKAWADLGAGDGTFTRALVTLLGPACRIYAVERDRRALASLMRWATHEGANVAAVVADFTGAFDLPDLGQDLLDGMLIANALHYIRRPDIVLARLVQRLRPGARFILVEYDRRRGNPWVPHPIPAARWPALAASAGLTAPVITARQPSAFGGELYVAAADR